MAGNRYQSVFRMEDALYIEESPVIICAGALLQDTRDGRVLVQLKLRNITNKIIVGCRVCIHAFDDGNNEVSGLPEAAYSGLSVPRNQDFGTKQALYLPDISARSFAAAVIEVRFADGTVWTNEDCAWEVMPKPETVYAHFDTMELAKQFLHEAGHNAAFAPMEFRDLVYCTCGYINRAGEEKCASCGQDIPRMLSVIHDEEGLKERCAARIRQEEENRERIRLAKEKEAEARRIEDEKILAEEQAAAERKPMRRLVKTVRGLLSRWPMWFRFVLAAAGVLVIVAIVMAVGGGKQSQMVSLITPLATDNAVIAETISETTIPPEEPIQITLADYIEAYNDLVYNSVADPINTKASDTDYIDCAKTLINKMLRNPSTATYNAAKVYERDAYGRAIVYLDVSAQNGYGGWNRTEYYVCIQSYSSDGRFTYSSTMSYIDGESISLMETFKGINDFGTHPADEELQEYLIDTESIRQLIYIDSPYDEKYAAYDCFELHDGGYEYQEIYTDKNTGYVVYVIHTFWGGFQFDDNKEKYHKQLITSVRALMDCDMVSAEGFIDDAVDFEAVSKTSETFRDGCIINHVSASSEHRVVMTVATQQDYDAKNYWKIPPDPHNDWRWEDEEPYHDHFMQYKDLYNHWELYKDRMINIWACEVTDMTQKGEATAYGYEDGGGPWEFITKEDEKYYLDFSDAAVRGDGKIWSDTLVTVYGTVAGWNDELGMPIVKADYVIPGGNFN